MGTVIDHTIVPVRDRDEAVEFYSRIFGFEDLGEVSVFKVVRVNDTFNLDFEISEDFKSLHYAFAMGPDEFEAAFDRIRESGITYGNHPHDHENMKGPGESMGAKGMGKAVYFEDPNGHVLEIKTY